VGLCYFSPFFNTTNSKTHQIHQFRKRAAKIRIQIHVFILVLVFSSPLQPRSMLRNGFWSVWRWIWISKWRGKPPLKRKWREWRNVAKWRENEGEVELNSAMGLGWKPVLSPGRLLPSQQCFGLPIFKCPQLLHTNSKSDIPIHYFDRLGKPYASITSKQPNSIIYKNSILIYHFISAKHTYGLR